MSFTQVAKSANESIMALSLIKVLDEEIKPIIDREVKEGRGDFLGHNKPEYVDELIEKLRACKFESVAKKIIEIINEDVEKGDKSHSVLEVSQTAKRLVIAFKDEPIEDSQDLSKDSPSPEVVRVAFELLLDSSDYANDKKTSLIHDFAKEALCDCTSAEVIVEQANSLTKQQRGIRVGLRKLSFKALRVFNKGKLDPKFEDKGRLALVKALSKIDSRLLLKDKGRKILYPLLKALILTHRVDIDPSVRKEAKKSMDRIRDSMPFIDQTFEFDFVKKDINGYLLQP